MPPHLQRSPICRDWLTSLGLISRLNSPDGKAFEVWLSNDSFFPFNLKSVCVALCPLLSTLSAGAGAGRALHPFHLRLRHLLSHTLQAAGGRGARRLRGAASRQDEHRGGQRQVTTRRRRKSEESDLWGSRGSEDVLSVNPRYLCAFIFVPSIAKGSHSTFGSDI